MLVSPVMKLSHETLREPQRRTLAPTLFGLMLSAVGCGDSSGQDQGDTGLLTGDGGVAGDLGTSVDDCSEEETQVCIGSLPQALNACVVQEDACLQASTGVTQGLCTPERARCETRAHTQAGACLLDCGSNAGSRWQQCLSMCPEPHANCRTLARGSFNQCRNRRPEAECLAEYESSNEACDSARQACEAQCVAP